VQYRWGELEDEYGLPSPMTCRFHHGTSKKGNWPFP